MQTATVTPATNEALGAKAYVLTLSCEAGPGRDSVRLGRPGVDSAGWLMPPIMANDGMGAAAGGTAISPNDLQVMVVLMRCTVE